MRVWLDDIRPMPEGFTHHARTAEEAIALLATGAVEYISLDHDLDMVLSGRADGIVFANEDEAFMLAEYGDADAATGSDVANWIARAAHEGQIPRLGWALHTANPAGRQYMQMAMQEAERHWNYTPSSS